MTLRLLSSRTAERTSLGLVGLAVALFAACEPSGPSTGSGGAAAGGAVTTGGAPGSGGIASGGGGGASGGDPGSGGASGGEAATGGTSAQDCSQPSDAGPLTTRLPCLLSDTGLYESDMVTLGDGVHPYEPMFHLWTDGADKKRWISLPPGEQIDSTDMDFWVFPTGTRLWKEFSRDGIRIETRLIEKQSTGAWQTVAYQWRGDQTEADAVPNGVENASGTQHDIPSTEDCLKCHSQQPDKALGFSAIQLSHAPANASDPLEWTLGSLRDGDLLSAPPAEDFVVPGTPEEREFFGYLHANCGHCHNPKGTANTQTGLDMWLKVADLDGPVTEFSVYKALYNVDIVALDGEHPDAPKRVTPGSVDDSAIYQRFLDKDQAWKMPPLGSNEVDPTGQAAMEAWIDALPPP